MILKRRGLCWISLSSFRFSLHARLAQGIRHTLDGRAGLVLFIERFQLRPRFSQQRLTRADEQVRLSPGLHLTLLTRQLLDLLMLLCHFILDDRHLPTTRCHSRNPPGWSSPHSHPPASVATAGSPPRSPLSATKTLLRWQFYYRFYHVSRSNIRQIQGLLVARSIQAAGRQLTRRLEDRISLWCVRAHLRRPRTHRAAGGLTAHFFILFQPHLKTYDFESAPASPPGASCEHENDVSAAKRHRSRAPNRLSELQMALTAWKR